MAFANTAAIVTGSYISSVGMYMVTGGRTNVSVGFGFGSYNFSNGEFGFLGKKGNSAMENIGYSLGALANLADINLAINSTKATLYTQERYPASEGGGKDIISHSGIVSDEIGETLMSFGPASSPHIKGYAGFALEPKLSTTDYPVPISLSKSVSLTVNKYSFAVTRSLGKILPYQGATINCVNMSSLSLWLNGIPNIGIHPYLLHYSVLAYNSGFRPDLFSHYLYNR